MRFLPAFAKVSCVSCADFETMSSPILENGHKCFELPQNAKLTWVSDRFRADANSTRSGVERYLCASNLRSSPHNC